MIAIEDDLRTLSGVVIELIDVESAQLVVGQPLRQLAADQLLSLAGISVTTKCDQ
ncbi:hypothetical protein SDC9_83431 [bioreactor metagenome]|uniref:Uncharacterized protein n=1 Tax=bioreactor metagenome TaxID=1076179 RepID=A0A644Z972_9ZZZZ